MRCFFQKERVCDNSCMAYREEKTCLLLKLAETALDTLNKVGTTGHNRVVHPKSPPPPEVIR